MTDNPHDQDPNGPAGFEEGNAKIGDCEVTTEAFDQHAETGVPQFMEEIHEAYVPRTEVMVEGPDGLPRAVDETDELAIAPPFTVDHLVCMEDTRVYVEVFTEDLPYFDDHIDHRSMYDADGKPVKRLRFTPESVDTSWGIKHAYTCNAIDVVLTKNKTEDDGFVVGVDIRGEAVELRMVAVRPIRERCIHYHRQLLSNDGQPDPNTYGNKLMFRNCTARRSVGGAFLSLINEAVYACTHREPRHLESEEKYLDGPDRERIKNEGHKAMLPLFGGLKNG